MNFDKKSRNMLKTNMKAIEKLDLSMLSVFFSEKKRILSKYLVNANSKWYTRKVNQKLKVGIFL